MLDVKTSLLKSEKKYKKVSISNDNPNWQGGWLEGYIHQHDQRADDLNLGHLGYKTALWLNHLAMLPALDFSSLYFFVCLYLWASSFPWFSSSDFWLSWLNNISDMYCSCMEQLAWQKPQGKPMHQNCRGGERSSKKWEVSANSSQVSKSRTTYWWVSESQILCLSVTYMLFYQVTKIFHLGLGF